MRTRPPMPHSSPRSCPQAVIVNSTILPGSRYCLLRLRFRRMPSLAYITRPAVPPRSSARSRPPLFSWCVTAPLTIRPVDGFPCTRLSALYAPKTLQQREESSQSAFSTAFLPLHASSFSPSSPSSFGKYCSGKYRYPHVYVAHYEYVLRP
jgi:hypothetical protein